MKIVLLKNIQGQGKEGDILEVNDGYARNFLIPKLLAKEATPNTLNSIKLRKEADIAREMQAIQEAKELAEKLKEMIVSVKVKCGEGERTYGSVTTQDIASALHANGIEIDKRKLSMKDSIRTLGNYEIEAKLHIGITAKFLIKVEKL